MSNQELMLKIMTYLPIALIGLPVLSFVLFFGFLTSFLWLPPLLILIGAVLVLKNTKYGAPINNFAY